MRSRPHPCRPVRDARGDADGLELTTTQMTVARRMAQSATEIPTFTVAADADVSEIVALRWCGESRSRCPR